MEYKVNEIFLSLKGEGVYSGKPMFFIRLATCNLSCKSCDTEFTKPLKKMQTAEILSALFTLGGSESIKQVVITGGEPLQQDMYDLAHALRAAGFFTHLETNGTLALKDRDWFSWVAISPKEHLVRVPAGVVGVTIKNTKFANEVKFPVRNAADLVEAEKFRAQAQQYASDDCVWYLHPWNDAFEELQVWKDGEAPPDHRTSKSLRNDLHTLCITHALKRNWRVSLQYHKILEIK